VIARPGSSPAPTLRAAKSSEAATIQAIWEASHALDDPAGRPRGGWSVDVWATHACALALGEQLVGVAAVRADSPPADVVDGRIALDPAHRKPDLASLLVQGALDLARKIDGDVLRLFVPTRADWAQPAVAEGGFEPVRTVCHMLLAGDVAVPELDSPPGLAVRAMRDGEEPRVLEALNRNWADTWGFNPIGADMLAHDLEGQRAGMLLGVDSTDDSRILATCHAVFDPTDRNPDGRPRAWISNLTVDPDARSRGFGRALLLAGLNLLRQRGAGSITLGVDADDPAPVRLYESVGFKPVSSIQVWDKHLHG
jgi:mycothiol synthase